MVIKVYLLLNFKKWTIRNLLYILRLFFQDNKAYKGALHLKEVI